MWRWFQAVIDAVRQEGHCSQVTLLLTLLALFSSLGGQWHLWKMCSVTFLHSAWLRSFLSSKRGVRYTRDTKHDPSHTRYSTGFTDTNDKVSSIARVVMVQGKQGIWKSSDLPSNPAWCSVTFLHSAWLRSFLSSKRGVRYTRHTKHDPSHTRYSTGFTNTNDKVSSIARVVTVQGKQGIWKSSFVDGICFYTGNLPPAPEIFWVPYVPSDVRKPEPKGFPCIESYLTSFYVQETTSQ